MARSQTASVVLAAAVAAADSWIAALDLPTGSSTGSRLGVRCRQSCILGLTTCWQM